MTPSRPEGPPTLRPAEVMAEPWAAPSMPERKLTRRDIFKVFMYSWLNQAAWNYERMQGQGYCISMLPGLKKLHWAGEDLARWLRAHMDFFNTETHVFNIVLGVDLALEEEGADEETIRQVKTSLMGPLSGIGDVIFGLILMPAFFALGASLAVQGDWLGPAIALLLWVPVTWIAKYSFTAISYHYGPRIGKLIEESGRIRDSLAVFALAILGGLTAMYVKATTPFQLTLPTESNGAAVFSLQNLLDAVMPKLLALAVTGLVFYALHRRGWSLGRTVFVLFVIGIVLAYLGVLA